MMIPSIFPELGSLTTSRGLSPNLVSMSEMGVVSVVRLSAAGISTRWLSLTSEPSGAIAIWTFIAKRCLRAAARFLASSW